MEHLPQLIISPRKEYTVKDVLDVARRHRTVKISAATTKVVEGSHRAFLKARKKGLIIYGSTTKYGAMVNCKAPSVQDDELKQLNLVYSLNCGSGPPLPEECVRAAILARLFSLSQGYSGVRPAILYELARMLNENDIPEIPEDGSIGASGDLVPLSYITLHLKKKVELKDRDALAISNGTSVMTGILASAVADLLYLQEISYKLFITLFQCFEGVESVFDETYHELKKHPEQQKMAGYFRNLLSGNKLTQTVEERKAKGEPIQDWYSLRCLAQETGPDLSAINSAILRVNCELNSVSDNPVIMPHGSEMPIMHGGHFDGRWITRAAGEAGFAIQGTTQLNKAYIQRLSSSKLNDRRFHDYLVAHDTGFNNALQGLNLSASACHATIMHLLLPYTLLMQTDYENANQDVVSLGMHAALAIYKACDVLRANIARLAIFTRQAVKIRDIENKLSPASRKLYGCLKRRIPFVRNDRPLHDDIKRLEASLKNHEI